MAFKMTGHTIGILVRLIPGNPELMAGKKSPTTSNIVNFTLMTSAKARLQKTQSFKSKMGDLYNSLYRADEFSASFGRPCD